ncbi:MAG: hypothetical protein CMM91_09720 [Rickettsiales bacterium]|nr:hypothetical protein [Rickettsiales bacterium]
MGQDKHIICVKWGNKFIPEYVNILKNMCKRQCTVDFTFNCLTDDPTGLDSDINVIKFPDNPGAIKTWWSKLYMFHKDLPLSGELLYFDLDVVIFRNIDNLWTYNAGQNKLMIIQDFNRCRMEDWKVSNSSVMRFTAGTLHYLWEMYAQNPHAVQGRMHGDQDWITSKGTKDIVWWPRTWIQSYKWELVGKKDTKIKNGAKHVFQHPPTIPDDCSVAVFHGEPKPFNCGDPLVVDNWK